MLQASELRQTDGEILNLASGVYFANAYEVNYFSEGLQKNIINIWDHMQCIGMINYCFDNGYDRYNFYGLSGDLLKTVKTMVFIALRGFNVRIEN